MSVLSKRLLYLERSELNEDKISKKKHIFFGTLCYKVSD